MAEEKAITLYERLLRLPDNDFWNTYATTSRNLKTQVSFRKFSTKNKQNIMEIPNNFLPSPNPLKTEQINYCIELINKIHKKETHILDIKFGSLET